MIPMPYVCLYARYKTTLAPFDDAQRGRLIWAMLEYADTGKTPTFDGPEAYIWPTLQAQLDRDFAEYELRVMKNRANGRKGGRPKSRPVLPETEWLFSEPKEANTNTKTKTNTKTNTSTNTNTREEVPEGTVPKPRIDPQKLVHNLMNHADEYYALPESQRPDLVRLWATPAD